jgi:hypothetical protein
MCIRSESGFKLYTNASLAVVLPTALQLEVMKTGIPCSPTRIRQNIVPIIPPRIVIVPKRYEFTIFLPDNFRQAVSVMALPPGAPSDSHNSRSRRVVEPGPEAVTAAV